jgi:hypothetical protein
MYQNVFLAFVSSRKKFQDLGKLILIATIELKSSYMHNLEYNFVSTNTLL